MLADASGLTPGSDFSLVFSPERVYTGRVFADLRRYPIDVVKLDRSLVTDIVTSGRDQRLAAAVVAMARHLDIMVTAEGVETPAQADVVRKLGCTGAQGFLWSPALPPADLEAMLAPR